MTQESKLDKKKKLGTSGNTGGRTIKESGWGSFSLTGRNPTIQRKWQKMKQPKGGSEKWHLKALGRND